MKNILLFLLTLLVPFSILIGQDQLQQKWHVSTGAGVAYSGGDDFGYSMDMAISRKLYKNFDVGVFFNLMSTQAIVNDLAQGFDGYGRAFSAFDIENLSNFFHNYRRKNFNNLGLQLSYTMIKTSNIKVAFSSGYYYAIWSTSFNEITSGEPFEPFIGYDYINTDGWGYHFSYEFGYKINEIVTVGLKGRYLSVQDELGTYVFIGVSF